MTNQLTKKDYQFILESLNYSKLKFENYEFPSYEIKRNRLNEVENVIGKVQAAMQESKTK